MVVAVAQAVKAAGLPAIAEGLKDILAGQVGILLRGGWPLSEVQQAAIDLALAWDEKRGHSRLAHLAGRVRLMDSEERIAKHRETLRLERAALSGVGSVNVPQDPSLHDFSQDPAAPPNTCRQCRGPLGVHVSRRRVNVE